MQRCFYRDVFTTAQNLNQFCLMLPTPSCRFPVVDFNEWLFVVRKILGDDFWINRG